VDFLFEVLDISEEGSESSIILKFELRISEDSIRDFLRRNR